MLWAASDEGVLARTLQRPLERDGHGDVVQMELLYRSWARRTDAGEVQLLFRDHLLSDLIGFTYTNQDEERSAHDLLARLRRIGRRWRERALPGAPLVTLILDGENAWEHYPQGGRAFLRALYRGLHSDPHLSAVTMTQAVAADTPGELPRVSAGSWIHADFSVWIGHEDDRRAWDALGDARDALTARAAAVPAEAASRAWAAYRAACASDWWWWYGDDRSSDNDVEFDRLFRRNLECVYRALELPVPDALRQTFITTRPVEPGVEEGVYRAPAAASMGRAGHGLRQIRFGAQDGHLQLSLEMSAAAAQVLTASDLAVLFRGPAPLRYLLTYMGGGGARVVREERGDNGWQEAPSGARVITGEAVELSIPVAELPRTHESSVLFQVALIEGGVELERHPEAAPIAVRVEEVHP
jgi:hypothetical protein